LTLDGPPDSKEVKLENGLGLDGPHPRRVHGELACRGGGEGRVERDERRGSHVDSVDVTPPPHEFALFLI
jgi:hypothetical protein